MSRKTPVWRLESGISRYLTPAGNPLSHSATAAFTLLIFLAISGVILFFFYPASFPENYEALTRFPKENLLAALMRGVHLHSADLVALFAIIHIARVLFGKRGRARKLFGSYVAGAALFLFILAQAITGSLLPMDEKSAAIIMMAMEKLPLPDGISSVFAVTGEAPGSAIVYLLALHLIPPFIAIGLLYAHLLKINEPRLFLKPLFLVGMTVGIMIAALDLPTTFPAADFSTIPGKSSFDWLLLFPLAIMSVVDPVIFWPMAMATLLALLGILLYASGKRTEPPVIVERDNCVGCGLCQIDCPYSAIAMEITPPEKKHPMIAIVDEDSCVGCEVCIGSCSFNALSTPGKESEAGRAFLKNVVENNRGEGKILVLVCESGYDIEFVRKRISDNSPTIIAPLHCAGELLTRSIEEGYRKGVESVIVAPCPEEECFGRHGSAFAKERLFHKRKPWLRKKYIKGGLTLYEGAGSGLVDTVERASARLLEGGKSKSRQIIGAGKSQLGRAVAVALVTFMTAGTALGLQALWTKTGFALNDSSKAQIALLVTSFNDLEVSMTMGGVTIIDEWIKPQKPLEAITFYRRIVAPKDNAKVKVLVTEKGKEKNEEITIEGPYKAGEVILIRFDQKRGVLEILDNL